MQGRVIITLLYAVTVKLNNRGVLCTVKKLYLVIYYIASQLNCNSSHVTSFLVIICNFIDNP